MEETLDAAPAETLAGSSPRQTDELAERVTAAASFEEEALLRRLQAGEDDAYRELIHTYGTRLLAVARRIMRTEEDARDCVQDAFLSAFRSIDRFEGKATLGTWLHRIVVNACLMKLRTHKRKPEELVDPGTAEFDRYGFRAGPTEIGNAGAESLLEREEVREQVRAGINSLPDDFRIVLLLRDIEELTTQETAEILETTTGAVKVRLHRARLALKKKIENLFE